MLPAFVPVPVEPLPVLVLVEVLLEPALPALPFELLLLPLALEFPDVF